MLNEIYPGDDPRDARCRDIWDAALARLSADARLVALRWLRERAQYDSQHAILVPERAREVAGHIARDDVPSTAWGLDDAHPGEIAARIELVSAITGAQGDEPEHVAACQSMLGEVAWVLSSLRGLVRFLADQAGGRGPNRPNEVIGVDMTEDECLELDALASKLGLHREAALRRAALAGMDVLKGPRINKPTGQPVWVRGRRV